MQTLREQGLGEKAIISSDILTTGGSWVCSWVDHTGSAVLRKPCRQCDQETCHSVCMRSLSF